MQKTCCQCNGCPKVAFPEDIMNYIKECLARPYSESYLIPILHRIQNHYGYLKTEYLDEVSNLMSIPTSKISGVATFYSLFTFTPKGEKRISICLGTACYVKGSGKILARLEELLGIKEGGVTKDGKISLKQHDGRCLCYGSSRYRQRKSLWSSHSDNVIDILKEHGYQA